MERGRAFYSEMRLNAPMVMRQEKCGYRSDGWPDKHEWAGVTGHMPGKGCRCGAFLEQGADYTGRWEDRMQPKLKGDKK